MGVAWICQHSFPVIGFSCEDYSFKKIDSAVCVFAKLWTSFPSLQVLSSADAAGVAASTSSFVEDASGSLFRWPVFWRRQRTRYCARNAENIFTNRPSPSSAAGHALGGVGRQQDRFFFSSFFGTLLRRRLFEHVVSLRSRARGAVCGFELASARALSLPFRTARVYGPSLRAIRVLTVT